MIKFWTFLPIQLYSIFITTTSALHELNEEYNTPIERVIGSGDYYD